jgi:hypothetical protein
MTRVDQVGESTTRGERQSDGYADEAKRRNNVFYSSVRKVVVMVVAEIQTKIKCRQWLRDGKQQRGECKEEDQRRREEMRCRERERQEVSEYCTRSGLIANVFCS